MTNKMTVTELADWYENHWPGCGCADTDIMKKVLFILKQSPIRLKNLANNPTEELLMEHLLLTMDHAGLLEHGSSVRCPWTTELGDRVAKGMEEYGYDYLEWDREADE